MGRRHRFRGRAGSGLDAAWPGFRRTVEHVEAARASLAGAAPTGRGSGVPLAEALAAFETGLAAARAEMNGWRVAELGAVWGECREALDEASRRAERLRLEANPEGYEQLYGLLGDLMEPLSHFAVARDRFRRRGL